MVTEMKHWQHEETGRVCSMEESPGRRWYEIGSPISITETPCDCPLCKWTGVVLECESGDDGSLACPNCYHLVNIEK